MESIKSIQNQEKGKWQAASSQISSNGAMMEDNREPSIQLKTNRTGLPNQLKSGIEQLSGHSMDDVKVHYNSSKPAQVQAHAFAQGTDIHVASGQEKHLAHEAWHVVQQKQGRVKPTMQLKDKVNINDDASLEKEADLMGGKAMQLKQARSYLQARSSLNSQPAMQFKRNLVIQMKPTSIHFEPRDFTLSDGNQNVVGYKMNAHLNHTEPIKGSAPGSGIQAELMQDLKASHFKRMVRGHLLNGQLGGLGIAANLYPITTQANSKHKNYVENPIKDQIKKNQDIDYSVTVEGSSFKNDKMNLDAFFVCEAKNADSSFHLKQRIHSQPTKDDHNSGAEGAAMDKGVSMSFASKDLPANWGEKGHGYNEGDADHKHTLSKVEGSQDWDPILKFGSRNYREGDIDLFMKARELIGELNIPGVAIKALNVEVDNIEKKGDLDELEALLNKEGLSLRN